MDASLYRYSTHHRASDRCISYISAPIRPEFHACWYPMKPYYSAIICDLDGTVYRGGKPLPGAIEALARLREINVRVLFVSNNPTRTASSYALRLSDLGLPTAAEEVLTSGLVVADWLCTEAAHARVFLVGESSLNAALTRQGVTLVERGRDAEVVVVSFDRTFDYHKWREAFDAVRRGAVFVATNPDMTCPIDNGEVPDCGGIIAAIEATTGRSPDFIIGKPSSIMAQAAMQRLQSPAHETLVVGDRLETDVRLGVSNGFHTALVLTGVSSRDDVSGAQDQPTYVLHGLADLPSVVVDGAPFARCP
ncbi:HAD-IIA family hydrolase [Streptomyces sp. NPDC019396]|uniref:HAD-IIA family hydrolase n=1 Tax=Streptomyces sp. NPDC019396 TaxID=3154687 RepID=UPI0033DF969E